MITEIIDKYLGEAKKDIWGKNLSPYIEDYKTTKHGEFTIESYFDNSTVSPFPWKAFVIGLGVIGTGGDRKEAITKAKIRLKTIDRGKWINSLESYRKAGIIK